MADPSGMGMSRRLLAALPSLLVLAAVLAMRMAEPAAFQRAELAAFDILQRHRPREYEPVPDYDGLVDREGVVHDRDSTAR